LRIYLFQYNKISLYQINFWGPQNFVILVFYLSCPCPHLDGTWERGGTSPHITNRVLLHTVPSDNILATVYSVNLTFFHISLAIKTGDSSNYTFWNPYFHGLLVFSVTYPHSLALYEYVWSASHSTCTTLVENAECQVNRGLDGPEIWPGSPEEMKNLLTQPGNLTSFTHSSIQATDYQPHQLHYHRYHSTVSLILNICFTVVTNCLYSSHFSFSKKWIKK